MSGVGGVLNKILKPLGLNLERIANKYPDFEGEFKEIYEVCRAYTMTSPERMYALYQAVKYLELNNITGNVVECGVWKGGSSMLAVRTLELNSSFSREIYMYDTFEGMSEPSETDEDVFGKKMIDRWTNISREDKLFCYSTLDEVSGNMQTNSNYPFEKIHLVKGKVEDTIPVTMPGNIALLRLDTDWYESTYHELKHLYPLLVRGGVLIIDDYGHWKGAREAVDQYFSEIKQAPLLNRIDYTGRIMIKY